MKKYLTKEEILKKLPYGDMNEINRSLVPVVDDPVIVNVCDEFVTESTYLNKTRRPRLPIPKDDFLISNRPGLGYVKREKQKFIKFQRGESVEFVDDHDVDSFKKEQSYSLYLMKKWLTPDIDSFIQKNIIRPRAINNWRRLYLGVVNIYLLNRDTRYIIPRHNIYRESYIRFKNLYYDLKNKYAELQVNYEDIKEKIISIDLCRVQNVINAYKRELDFFRDEYLITNEINESLYKKIINLSNIHFENTVRNAYKRKEDQENYNKIIKTNRIMSILNAAVDPTLIKEEKWFGFIRNENLTSLWKICNTPHWLINFSSENDVPEIIELEREVVIEIIKISKFRRTKNGFNCLHFFLRRRGIVCKNVKGAEKFRQTFNKLFKFHENFDEKKHQYAICIEYLVLFFYSKHIMDNFDYLMHEHLKKEKSTIDEKNNLSDTIIYEHTHFEYSDHDINRFISDLTSISLENKDTWKQ
jgi:hypothetical protein